MSALEEAARPWLTALMRAEPITLDASALQTVAQWLTLKIIVAEHDSQEVAAVTADERRSFFERREIPGPLKIWAFASGAAQWRSAYYRSSFTLWRLPVPAIPPKEKNVASVTFGLADLVAFAVYDGPAVLNVRTSERAGTQVWPPLGVPFEWPPQTRLNHAQVLALAHKVETFARHPNVRLVPDGAQP